MIGFKIPNGAQKSQIKLANEYFNKRFPSPTLDKTENPNYETSGCGISVVPTAEEESLVIGNCTIKYTNTNISFEYKAVDAIKNSVNIIEGSSKKLDALESIYNKIKLKLNEKRGGIANISKSSGKYSNYRCKIFYINNEYICIPDYVSTISIDNKIYSSYDAITWAQSDKNDEIGDVISEIGNNKIIAIRSKSNQTKVLAIYENSNWSVNSNYNYTLDLVRLCYGNGVWIATCGSAQYPKVSYSDDDCTTWKSVSLPKVKGDTNEYIYTDAWITYDGEKFILPYGVRTNAFYQYYYSYDGLVWASADYPDNIEGAFVNSVNNMVIAFAYNNNKPSNIYCYSYDGLNWNESYLPTKGNWRYCAYGDGLYVAIAWDLTTYAYSTDGINWRLSTEEFVTAPNAICYGDGKFVVATYGSFSIINLPETYDKYEVNTYSVSYEWENAPEGFELPATQSYASGETVTVDTYYTNYSGYIVDDNRYLKFSGWDHNDFVITEDTVIKGTWVEKENEPSISVDGVYGGTNSSVVIDTWMINSDAISSTYDNQIIYFDSNKMQTTTVDIGYRNVMTYCPYLNTLFLINLSDGTYSGYLEACDINNSATITEINSAGGGTTEIVPVESTTITYDASTNSIYTFYRDTFMQYNISTDEYNTWNMSELPMHMITAITTDNYVIVFCASLYCMFFNKQGTLIMKVYLNELYDKYDWFANIIGSKEDEYEDGYGLILNRTDDIPYPKVVLEPRYHYDNNTRYETGLYIAINFMWSCLDETTSAVFTIDYEDSFSLDGFQVKDIYGGDAYIHDMCMNTNNILYCLTSDSSCSEAYIDSLFYIREDGQCDELSYGLKNPVFTKINGVFNTIIPLNDSFNSMLLTSSSYICRISPTTEAKCTNVTGDLDKNVNITVQFDWNCPVSSDLLTAQADKNYCVGPDSVTGSITLDDTLVIDDTDCYYTFNGVTSDVVTVTTTNPDESAQSIDGDLVIDETGPDEVIEEIEDET